MHVKEINASKKLPHIPNTEKVEKVSKKSISAVGSTSPKIHDTVLIKLKLRNLEDREIIFSEHYSGQRFYLKLSTTTANICWSRLITQMKTGEIL